MIRSETLTKIAPALVKAQEEMGSAVKGSKNPFFKSNYADLNAIREAVIPALNNNRIAVFQPTIERNGELYVQTILIHESGEFWGSDGTKVVCAKQNDPQAQGSAISYARRYDLQSTTMCGAKDDDGEAAVDRETPKETKNDPANSFRKPKSEKKVEVKPETKTNDLEKWE